MAQANVSVVSVHSSGPNYLYTIGNITTPWINSDVGQPVIQSNLGRSVVLVMNIVDVNQGANISYNNTNGVFSLSGNVTYQLTASARLLNSIPDQAALAWVDRTIGGTVGQPAKFDNISSTNITYYTPSRDTTVVLTAAAGSPTSGLTWSYPAQVTNATAAIQAVSGWIE
jgi:hypothetical protein